MELLRRSGVFWGMSLATLRPANGEEGGERTRLYETQETISPRQYPVIIKRYISGDSSKSTSSTDVRLANTALTLQIPRCSQQAKFQLSVVAEKAGALTAYVRAAIISL